MGDPQNLGPAALRWQRACATSGCVEVALTDDTVHVRNSERPDLSYLSFTHEEWATFLTGAKAGLFDVA